MIQGSDHFEARGSSPSDKSYYTIPKGKEDSDSDEERKMEIETPNEVMQD